MSTPAQQSSSDRLASDYAFRSITSLLQVIETRSVSRTASEPPFIFSNTNLKNFLTQTLRHQLRINTALSVIAVRTVEVVTVMSSTEKTADVSNDYVVFVNPRLPILNKNLQPHDVLVHQTTGSDVTIPRVVMGKADEFFLSNSDFVQ
jgi:hypothetical protein